MTSATVEMAERPVVYREPSKLSTSTTAYANRWLPRIDEQIRASLRADDPHALFMRSSQYLFAAGGKRIRGLVTVATCELTGGNPEDALGVSCALELLHASSLILDDLPCMDDASSRRGVAALHREFGEATAILTAMLLFNLAHEHLAEHGAIPPERARWRHRYVSRALGGGGMIGGQQADLLLRRGAARSALAEVHVRKTSSLMAAALVAGAFTGHASVLEAEELASLGELLGRVYQLTDDALDASEDPASCRVEARPGLLSAGLRRLRERYPVASAARLALEDVAALAAHRLA